MAPLTWRKAWISDLSPIFGSLEERRRFKYFTDSGLTGLGSSISDPPLAQHSFNIGPVPISNRKAERNVGGLFRVVSASEEISGTASSRSRKDQTFKIRSMTP
jgi:hypothetical protein